MHRGRDCLCWPRSYTWTKRLSFFPPNRCCLADFFIRQRRWAMESLFTGWLTGVAAKLWVLSWFAPCTGKCWQVAVTVPRISCLSSPCLNPHVSGVKNLWRGHQRDLFSTCVCRGQNRQCLPRQHSTPRPSQTSPSLEQGSAADFVYAFARLSELQFGTLWCGF